MVRRGSSDPRKALEDAERKLASDRARQQDVDGVVSSLVKRLEENHFAERLAIAFGRDPGD